MTPEQNKRRIESAARDYAYMHKHRMLYADTEAHSVKHFLTPDDQKAFINAVLDTNIKIQMEESKRSEGLFPFKSNAT